MLALAHRQLPRAAAIVVGVLLVIAPPGALVLKALSAGWILVAIVFVSPVLALGYLLQFAIVITGLLLPRGVFVTRGHWRPLIAAVLTSLGVLALGFFLVDFDDAGAGYSVFTDLVVGHGAVTYSGGSTSAATTAMNVSSTFAVTGAFLWLVGWVWLIAEWIVALVARSRARRAARLA